MNSLECGSWFHLACVASVSVEFSALKSRFSYFWTRAKWGENEKREGGGEERGRKETLACKPHDFAERPLDTFTLERTLVECLSNTPCGFVVKVRWKQSALGQDLLLFSVCLKYSKPGNFVSFNPDGV